MNAHSQLAPVVFVLGAPRSGTTLFRVMLAGHPRLFSPPEMILAPFDTMKERSALLTRRFWEKGGLRRAVMDLTGCTVEEARATVAEMESWTTDAVYRWIQERIGDRMLVDKCIHIVADPARLPGLPERFPGARYLWLLRHPGSVTRSLQNMPMAEVMTQGYGSAREVWRRANTALRDLFSNMPEERWTRVRYEDLVESEASRREVMERVSRVIGVPFDEAMLRPYEGDRMRDGPKGARAIGDPNMAGRGEIDPGLATKWLEGFDPQSLDEETWALAAELGYDLSALPRPPMADVTTSIDGLLQTVRELEHSIDLPGDLDAVEGRRFLMRMLSQSVDTYLEYTDADRPVFHHAEGPTRKMFADCPDTDYLRASIQVGPGRVYRLWGHIPEGTTYVGILLYGKGGRISNRLTDADLSLNQSREFELRISTEEQPGVWLKADGDERSVIVRQYFSDRSVQRPIDVHVELEGELPPASPLDPADTAKRLGLARRMLKSIWSRTTQALGMVRAGALNKFIVIPGEQLFPTPDNHYQVCWYRFGGDQVMFVRGRLPTARYFSFCLYNAWMESLDYGAHRCWLNHSQIETDADGRFEVVLAHRDPGLPNWLDTGGHHAGYLLARSLLLEGEPTELEIQVKYERELVR